MYLPYTRRHKGNPYRHEKLISLVFSVKFLLIRIFCTLYRYTNSKFTRYLPTDTLKIYIVIIVVRYLKKERSRNVC